MQPAVLVLNCGSSSLKYSLVEPDPGTSVAHGIVERIGSDHALATLAYGGLKVSRERRVTDHDAALRMEQELGFAVESDPDDATLRIARLVLTE